MADDGTHAPITGQTTKFSDLPEDCIANIISLTTPRDACRFSPVSKTFLSIAASDAVWDRFLPPDYRSTLSRSSIGSDLIANSPTKKDLFLRLAGHPVLIDGDTAAFSVVKSTGKKCIAISARSLTIAWGDAPEYWDWIRLPESSTLFPEVAALECVWWFEIRGKVKGSMLSPRTNYAAYLVFSKGEDDLWGFDVSADPPLEATVVDEGGGKVTRHVYLARGKRKRWSRWLGVRAGFPIVRKDGWMEVEIGEFATATGGGEGDGEIEMSLMEVKEGNSKGGLIVQKIEIRPKE